MDCCDSYTVQCFIVVSLIPSLTTNISNCVLTVLPNFSVYLLTMLHVLYSLFVTTYPLSLILIVHLQEISMNVIIIWKCPLILLQFLSSFLKQFT